MTREEAVRSLMRFDQPAGTLGERLRNFPYEWDNLPLGILTREHVLSVLERWQVGELSEGEVEEWANLLECREDLDLDPEDNAVATAVFNLANPVLEGPLTEQGPKLLKWLST